MRLLPLSFLPKKIDKAIKALCIETKSREVVCSVMHLHILKFLPLCRYIIKQVQTYHFQMHRDNFQSGERQIKNYTEE